MTPPNDVPVEVMRRLAEADLAVMRGRLSGVSLESALAERELALDAYRAAKAAAEPKLRTESERNADVAKLLRDYDQQCPPADGPLHFDCLDIANRSRLTMLIRERCRPDDPPPERCARCAVPKSVEPSVCARNLLGDGIYCNDCAREEMRAKDPPPERRLTEAERALCDYAAAHHRAFIWTAELVNRLNAVRDERREPNHTDVVQPEPERWPVRKIEPVDDPERCGCDEATALRDQLNKLKIAADETLSATAELRRALR